MSYRRTLSLLIVLGAALGCGGDGGPEREPGKLNVAAASSLRPALDSLIEIWNREHRSMPARAIYGASGTLFAQIGSDAPFDLFLSADDVYPRRLHDDGRADEPFRFASGRLAIWTPEAIDPVRTIEDLSRPRFDKIAVASPNLAPYGEASLEALERVGLYDQLKGRLVFAGNVMEAAHFAESGGAEVALLSLSLVTSTDLASRGNYVVVPADLHDPILHEGALLTASPNRGAGAQFVEFLLGEEGREVLERSGLQTGPDAESERPK